MLKYNLEQGVKLQDQLGTHVPISGSDGNYSIIKMTSGEIRKIDSRCLATICVLSNPDQKNISIGKAGRSRWLGRRPHTRGVVNESGRSPTWGGEGKSAGGRHPVSRSGVSAKGLKTRDNKRTDKFIVRRRKARNNHGKIYLERSICRREALLKKLKRKRIILIENLLKPGLGNQQ